MKHTNPTEHMHVNKNLIDETRPYTLVNVFAPLYRLKLFDQMLEVQFLNLHGCTLQLDIRQSETLLLFASFYMEEPLFWGRIFFEVKH